MRKTTTNMMHVIDKEKKKKRGEGQNKQKKWGEVWFPPGRKLG